MNKGENELNIYVASSRYYLARLLLRGRQIFV